MLMADPYESLANAIITTAAKRFFRSSWYAALTIMDSEFLIRRLREEALKK